MSLVVAAVGLVAARGVPAAGSPLVETASYVPVGPSRLADTREPGGFSRLDPSTIRVNVSGRAGVPDAAVAAVLTVTVTDSAAAGFVSVWPAGLARPTTSVINTNGSGQTVANTVTVQLAGGAVDLYTSTPAALVIDVVGAYVAAGAARAGRFVAVPPTRMIDTRAGCVPLAAGQHITVPLGPLVPDDATGVVVNLTVDASVGAGFWTVHPAGTALPLASALDTDSAGETRSSLTVVPLSGRAAIEVFSQTGGQVIVDLVGWFTGPTAPEASSGLFVPVAPHRLFDTRVDATPLAPGASVRTRLPAGVIAVVGNLTATDGLGGGYLTAHPDGAADTGTSSLDFALNQTVANQAIISAGADGGASVDVAGSPAQAVFDVTGYFVDGPTSIPADGPSTIVGRFAPSVADVTVTSVPADVLVPTSRQTLLVGVNPINGHRGEGHVGPGTVGCIVDRDAPRACLVATLDLLGFNVAGFGLDQERRLHDAVAVIQLDAGLVETGMADEDVYRYLGIWPGTATLGAEEQRVIGTSQQGRPLLALRFGHGPIVTMVVAETHGDEEAGLRVVLHAVRQAVPTNATLWVIPYANPDGLALDTRFLANGADPNRAAPFQPEQRAVLDLARSVHPTTSVYYHQNYGWIGGSGQSMQPARTYQSLVHTGALRPSGSCTAGFLWCPIDVATGSSSVLVELPDIVTPAVVHEHARALLATITG
jgi:hypothetical protein